MKRGKFAVLETKLCSQDEHKTGARHCSWEIRNEVVFASTAGKHSIKVRNLRVGTISKCSFLFYREGNQ